MTRLALLIFLLVCLASSITAQKKTTSSLCTRDNAVDTTKQQLLITRTFDNPVQRIAVLLRGADLLWPYEQEKSLAAFREAFDLAVQNFKETRWRNGTTKIRAGAGGVAPLRRCVRRLRSRLADFSLSSRHTSLVCGGLDLTRNCFRHSLVEN